MSSLPPVESIIQNSSLIEINDVYNENINHLQRSENILNNNYTAPFQMKSNSHNFWDYNICNKGPKKKSKIEDDECSTCSNFNYEDPIKTVPNCDKMIRSRKSEANNMAPDLRNFIKIRNNMHRLMNTYKHEIQRDNGKMSPKSRNVLASKICRLKKRAFHESLKIKYVALGLEYDELKEMISFVNTSQKTSLSKRVDQIFTQTNVIKAAGRLEEFINELLALFDSQDFDNPVLVRFLNCKSSEIVPCTDECQAQLHYTSLSPQSCQLQWNSDDELSQILFSDEYIDYLNSSTSSSFTCDLMNFP